MFESYDVPADERGALQAVAHLPWRIYCANLLRQSIGLRLAGKVEREQPLRDFGLTPQQIAYISQVITNARSRGWSATASNVEFSGTVEPDPEESGAREACPIPWNPTILTPVFWGRQFVSVGARGTPVTIYYPSLDGSPDGAAMLRDCGRRALILFLHGHCQQESDHLCRWERHLAQLARSGFVVAAPFHSDIGGGPLQNSLVDSALEALDWMRNSRSGRTELYPSVFTGVCGHSYGAMLAGRIAVRAKAKAYVSLSANWHEWSTFGTTLRSHCHP
jgi:acetyl esterase/lipase